MAELQSGTIVEMEVKEKQGSKWVLSLEGQEVSMNASEAPEELTEGDTLKVFLYLDRRGELSATSAVPDISLDTYGWAKVIRTSDREGAIVDIGTTKEIQVAPEDLPKIRSLWPENGDCLFMTLRSDKKGELFGRLVTEEKIQEKLIEAPTSVFNKNIKARPYRLLPVGSFLLSVPENYRVFVHNSEMVKEPRLGQEVEVRVIGVKEDGSINGSMLPRKQERISDDAEEIFRYLIDVGGKMPFSDDSSPEEIKEMFGLSKAAFKRAMGKLIKDGKVIQNEGWTELNHD